MSLNWNITEIANYEQVCREGEPDENGLRRLSRVTEALIFHTMTSGIGYLEEATIEEFVARVTSWEKVYGSSLMKKITDDDGIADRPITEEEIRAHIGLRTNVSPMSRATYIDRLFNLAFPKAVSPEKLNTSIYDVLFVWGDHEDEVEIEMRAKDSNEAIRLAQAEVRRRGSYPNPRQATVTTECREWTKL